MNGDCESWSGMDVVLGQHFVTYSRHNVYFHTWLHAVYVSHNVWFLLTTKQTVTCSGLKGPGCDQHGDQNGDQAGCQSYAVGCNSVYRKHTGVWNTLTIFHRPDKWTCLINTYDHSSQLPTFHRELSGQMLHFWQHYIAHNIRCWHSMTSHLWQLVTAAQWWS